MQAAKGYNLLAGSGPDAKREKYTLPAGPVETARAERIRARVSISPG
jgi:hypothetical protein